MAHNLEIRNGEASMFYISYQSGRFQNFNQSPNGKCPVRAIRYPDRFCPTADRFGDSR